MESTPMEMAPVEIYEMQAEISGALASPVRLRILDMVSRGDQPASELLEALNIPKANLSQHLSVLKSAGIVTTRREGRSQIVSLALPQILEACALVKRVLLERLALQERHAAQLRETMEAAE